MGLHLAAPLVQLDTSHCHGMVVRDHCVLDPILGILSHIAQKARGVQSTLAAFFSFYVWVFWVKFVSVVVGLGWNIQQIASVSRTPHFLQHKKLVGLSNTSSWSIGSLTSVVLGPLVVNLPGCCWHGTAGQSSGSAITRLAIHR